MSQITTLNNGRPPTVAPNSEPSRFQSGQNALGVRRILVVNGKGGCGKTTMATNLAGFYAHQGKNVALLDYDPQGSSMQWLTSRGEQYKTIHGVAAFSRPGQGVTRTWQMRIPADTERVILDAPAGVYGMQLVDLVREVNTILIPVLPSPIDIHAASRFIQELLLVAKVRTKTVKVGVIANRVRADTKIYRSLKRFLDSLNITFVTRLRDTQGYVQAADEGIGVYELANRNFERDKRHWERVVEWIEND